MQALTRWFQKQSSWLESQQASILSAAFIIFAANIASAGFGLIKNRVISAYYVGQDSMIDAYWVAFRLPDFMFQLIVMGTLSAAFVPVFAKLYKKDDETAFGLSRQLMLAILGLFLIGGLLVLLFTPQFIHLLTSENFGAEQTRLAISMTRIMLLAQFFFAISGFLSAMLQSVKRFILPAISPIFYNIGIIFSIMFFSDELGLYAAAWGTVIGAAMHMLIQLPLIQKIGFRLIGPLHWKKEHLQQVLQLAGPRTITLGVEQLSVFAVTYFATSVGGISLTLITFAQSLMTLPIRFFGVSIGQAALPFLSASQDDVNGFRQMVFRSLRQIAFFTAPSAVMLLVLRVALTRLAYGVGQFPWSSATLVTAAALGILAVSIPAQAATHLLVRSFYALGNSVVPFLASALYFLTTVILGWVLVLHLHWGVSGLALALTLASVIETAVVFAILMFKIGMKNIWSLLSALLRIGTAAFLMAVTLFVLQRLFDLYVFETSRVWELIKLTLVVSFAGGAVYLGFCWLLRIEELTILKRIYKKLSSQWSKLVSSSTTPELVGGVSQQD